jgi:hypothetical protein
MRGYGTFVLFFFFFFFFFDESKKALAISDVGKPWKLLILRQHACEGEELDFQRLLPLIAIVVNWVACSTSFMLHHQRVQHHGRRYV